MSFESAEHTLGDAYKGAALNLRDHTILPDGHYRFVDLYCTDKKCDCRKTMIQVFHDGKHVSTLNYGWESPNFYCKWMGIENDPMAKDMSGLSVDFSSPGRLDQQAILELVENLIKSNIDGDSWVSNIQKNYKLLRNPNILKFSRAPSRNAPCPCGSGKKYKGCCLAR